MNEPPTIDCERFHATLGVTDLYAAIDFYTQKLGFRKDFDWGDPPWFGGVSLGEVQVFLSSQEGAPKGCSLSFVVGDADELHAFHRANGVEIVQAPDDREYGLRDYTIRDPWGHYLDFGHYIYTVGEPIEIERVEVAVRLEKRLAAVLQDLTKVKGLDLTGVLEETLLHTFEPLGDGVAHPHTRSQVRKIQELKRKHGIDYDCHASYRFVER